MSRPVMLFSIASSTRSRFVKLDTFGRRNLKLDAGDVRDMVKHLKWAARRARLPERRKACSLQVCERDNKWFVVDGQRRTLAARRRSDIKDLPCMVYQTDSVKDEAASFVRTNTRRERVSTLQTYRASLTAGDETCVFLNGLISRSGLTVGISGSSRVVACIATLLSMAKKDREKLLHLWPLFVNMHPDSEMFGGVLKGIWSVETLWSRNDSGKSVTNEPSFSKLIRVGGKACRQEQARLALERGKGGDAVFRDAILAILKKRI